MSDDEKRLESVNHFDGDAGAFDVEVYRSPDEPVPVAVPGSTVVLRDPLDGGCVNVDVVGNGSYRVWMGNPREPVSGCQQCVSKRGLRNLAAALCHLATNLPG